MVLKHHQTNFYVCIEMIFELLGPLRTTYKEGSDGGKTHQITFYECRNLGCIYFLTKKSPKRKKLKSFFPQKSHKMLLPTDEKVVFVSLNKF